MDFTFGIVTVGESDTIQKIIDSINNQKISNYEIIIVGGAKIIGDRIKHIPYIDISLSGDISVKKNIITNNSKFDNIVYLHNYVTLSDNWYDGFLKFGDDFVVCMNKILNIDGTRYRDWCLWQDDANKYINNNNYLIPYEMSHLSKMMYISGAYWVAKKWFMSENSLNEKLSWGQGEDVEWSIRVRNKIEFKMNTFSTVKLLKNKKRVFNETNKDDNNILYNIKNYDDSNSYDELIKNHLEKWIR